MANNMLFENISQSYSVRKGRICSRTPNMELKEIFEKIPVNPEGEILGYSLCAEDLEGLTEEEALEKISNIMESFAKNG